MRRRGSQGLKPGARSIHHAHEDRRVRTRLSLHPQLPTLVRLERESPVRRIEFTAVFLQAHDISSLDARSMRVPSAAAPVCRPPVR